VLAALCAAFGFGEVVADATREMNKREEARLLETTVSSYEIVMAELVVGSESVTRRLYSNNTVAFSAQVNMKPADGVMWDQEVELVLTEDSYFPRRYEMTKVTTHEERRIEQWTALEMVSNVAVVSTRINQSTDTRNIELPAGTPVFETDILHLVHQLLFWYDRGSGGRQRFTVFDPMRGKTNDFVMLLSGVETLEVMGATTEVEVFTLEQGTVTGEYFLDGEGRLVGADLGYLSYQLVETVTESADEG